MRRQQHLLEVSVRADTARSQRNRALAAFICKTVFGLGLAFGAWFGGTEALRRWVWENQDFALTDIRVSTDGALQRDQILQAGEVKSGVNIFRVDTDHIRAGIDKLPQVERVDLQLVRPNRIDITVTERKPIAWVTEKGDEIPTASDKAWLIDARGVVMKTKRMIEEYLHLPHISGVPVADFVAGQRVNTAEMQATLELVRLDAENTRWQARNLDLSKGYCIIVTDQNHAKITFGLDEMDQQLDRLTRYLDRADAEKKEIQTVNLIVRKNTPVTFHNPEDDVLPEAEAQQAPPPVEEKEKPKAKEAASTKAATPKASTPIPRAMPVSTPLPVKAATAVSTKAKGDSRPPVRAKTTPASVRKPFRP
jgi:cell division septal protein FtsQ